jgi:hypothetical protein
MMEAARTSETLVNFYQTTRLSSITPSDVWSIGGKALGILKLGVISFFASADLRAGKVGLDI